MELAEILHRMRANVLLVDIDGTIRAAYGGSGALAGWPNDEVVGRSVLELLDSYAVEQLAETFAARDETSLTMRGISFPATVIAPDGRAAEFDVAPAGIDTAEMTGWLVTAVPRSELSPSADVLNRMLRGDSLDEVGLAIAQRLTYITEDSEQVGFGITWPGAPDSALLAGREGTKVGATLASMLVRGATCLWEPLHGLDVVSLDVEALPDDLRQAMDDDGFGQVLAMAVHVGGRLGFVLVQFVRDRNVASLLGSTQLAYGELSRALLRTIERSEGDRLLRDAALRDPLTGLLNRSGLDLVASKLGTGTAVLFVDVDRLKEVNDVCGHSVGDAVLVEIASRLRTELRPTDAVARLGGDEFAVVIPDSTEGAATDIAGRLLAAIAEPLPEHIGLERVTASIGVTLLSEGDSMHQALNVADLAMLNAKRGGRARIVTGSMNAAAGET